MSQTDLRMNFHDELNLVRDTIVTLAVSYTHLTLPTILRV